MGIDEARHIQDYNIKLAIILGIAYLCLRKSIVKEMIVNGQ